MINQLLKSELQFLKKILLDDSIDRPRTSKEEDLLCPKWIYAKYSGARWLAERLEYATTLKNKAFAYYCAWRRWSFLLNKFYRKLLGERVLRLATFPQNFYGSTLEDLCKHLVHSKSSSSRKAGDEIILVYPDQVSKLDSRATLGAYITWLEAGCPNNFTDAYNHAVILIGCELPAPLPNIQCDFLVDHPYIDHLAPVKKVS